MPISFSFSKADLPHINRILDRAGALYKAQGVRFDRGHHVMNLTACHASGCPLDFERLAGADDFNLMHDVSGIDNCIDRDTGELTRCFLPRFARKQVD